MGKWDALYVHGNYFNAKWMFFYCALHKLWADIVFMRIGIYFSVIMFIVWGQKHFYISRMGFLFNLRCVFVMWEVHKLQQLTFE